MSWVAVGTTAANIVYDASKSSKAPDPPDLSDQQMAADDIAAMNQEMAQMEQAWAEDAREQNRQVMEDVLGISMPTAQSALETGEEYQQRFENMFQPLEEELVAEARDYASPARIEREQAAAMADTAQAMDRQRSEALRRLESYGVDPSQTRNQALDVGVRVQQAAQQVQAAEDARQRVEETGRQIRGQAIELGQRYPGLAGRMTDQALNAGNQALNQQLETTQQGMQLGQAALPFNNAALNALNTSGQLATGQFGSQMQSAQATNQMQADAAGGIGAMVGSISNTWGQDTGMNTTGGANAAVAGNSQGIMVPNAADGGAVALAGSDSEGVVIDQTGRSNRSGIDDKAPIMASQGEYVIPADVVRVKGTEFFDKLLEKYHTPAAQQRSGQPALPAPRAGGNNG